MSKERITDALLSANFADGDILYGEDINKIIRILKAASNITKTEIDSILSSEKEFVFRTYEEAVTYTYDNIVEEGQFCLILENGLEIYKYIDNIWEIVEKFSLIDLYQREEQPDFKVEGGTIYEDEIDLETLSNDETSNEISNEAEILLSGEVIDLTKG